MNSTNISYGKLIQIKDTQKENYIYYYTAENVYVCCFKKSDLNYLNRA
jgi:hypothetical protein